MVYRSTIQRFQLTNETLMSSHVDYVIFETRMNSDGLLKCDEKLFHSIDGFTIPSNDVDNDRPGL